MPGHARSRGPWLRPTVMALVPLLSAALLVACSAATLPPPGASPDASGDPSLPSDAGASAAPPSSSGSSPASTLTPSAEPEELTGYRWPLGGGRIYSFFDVRDSGFFVIDGERVHTGIDVATFCGDQIRAAHDGTVVAAGRFAAREMGFDASLDPVFDEIQARGSLGEQSITVVIDDGNGYRSVYAHLADVTVEVGDTVAAGDQIGLEGATGNASGCHLHYELIRMDGPWMPVAREFVREALYPENARERIDPMRVLSLGMRGAPSLIPGIDPPALSPGLGRPTVVVP